MKKIFTLSLLLVLALTANAQYRKSWNFTNWSAATITNFMADPNWTDDEKADNYASKPATGQNCRWEIVATPNADGYVQANGAAIEELTGLTYISPSTNRGLAIATNYPDCTERDGKDFGPYDGPQYLWLCGKNTNYFVIPHVELGTTIKMGIESHKFSSARGVTLYMGNDNTGTALADPVDNDGNTVSGGNVKNYTDLTWTVPADAEATNDDGTVNLCIRCNSGGGMHIYYITVGDGDSPQVEDAKKVAYFGAEDGLAYAMLSATPTIALTTVEAPTLESLKDFDALVIGANVTAEQAEALKPLVAFFPIVNLNPALSDVFGMGTATPTSTNTLTIVDPTNAIFEGADEELTYAENITGVTLSDYAKNDAVLAKAGDVVAIHAHNAGRNAYYLVPNDEGNEYLVTTLIPQTIVAAAKTKKDVAAVGTPNITFKQEDGKSIVTITAANSKAIYYTTDGTEPTTASTLYSEPFELTVAATVKAFATGDGFTDSQIASKDVTIATKAAVPTIAVAREQGKSTITLACATEGVDIYYNYAGQTATTASVKYTEPFELTTPATLTVFAGEANGILASDMAQQFIGIDGINASNVRWDVMAHFNADSENWKGKGQQTDDSGAIINANYFFTWGKNAGKYWDETSEQVQKTDAEGNPVTDDDGNPVMTYTKALPASTYEAEGWIIKSIGQVMVWESLNIGWNIGDTSMRNPDTAEDAIGVNDEEGITKDALTFGKQPSDGPFNASLETTTKYQGPFDVIVYAGNGNEGEIPTMQIETSTDGETWTKLGDVNYSLIKRNWKKTKLSYEATDEVFVRLLHTAAKSSGQIYDIYLMNNGEKSKQYAEGGEIDGISTVQNTTMQNAVYSLGGIRQQSMKRGLNIVIENGVARKVLK
jgi:hypothetical protein